AVGQIVELLLDLRLNERPLLFHGQDDVESLRELEDALRLQRPGHADLVKPYPQLIGSHFVDAQLVERLAHVEIALAGRDDAKLRIRAAARNDAVELVGARIREDGRTLEIVQARLLGERLVAEADAQAAGRHGEIVGALHLDAIYAAVNGRGRL